MIKVAEGFQYSVNLGYDLYHDEKIENFIPTNSALDFMEDVLKSTEISSTERARVLVGAYGRGKSHMVLTTLSLLLKKDRKKFRHLLPKLQGRRELAQEIERYYNSVDKLLPVIISGSSTSIPQAFLTALEHTLRDENLLDIMPDTNYRAAIRCVHKWKNEFPDTYKRFVSMINGTVSDFLNRLKNYDILAYQEFEQLYPQLTAGSVFNPFIGFDVVELYESVLECLKNKGYTGIYVVYDEFSKFLEANIQGASVSDTKLLQDFAEKCNRSGEQQLHILLISHKEIANYIDKLPKQKTDGWRGVSERFKHIHLSDDYEQTYGIIGTAIQKNSDKWQKFQQEHSIAFNALEKLYDKHDILKEFSAQEKVNFILSCYPLHPVTTFILPRLAEKIAQNERTLFTFLSADSRFTLVDFLRQGTNGFRLLTPDYVFDYFMPLLEKDIYNGEIHTTYVLAKNILNKVVGDLLQGKIIKILALIYMVEQFELLKPKQEEIERILQQEYSTVDIDRALKDLIAKEYVIYLKRSNGYLCLKQSSGVDIYKKIADYMAANANYDIKNILNTINFDRYMYPARYNDEREMTRFFAFEFIHASEVDLSVDWEIKSENITADGVIYAILTESEEELAVMQEILPRITADYNRFIFVISKQYVDIKDKLLELHAVEALREAAIGDAVLYGEYDLVYSDLYDVLRAFVQSYTRPERGAAVYYHKGAVQRIHRRSQLSRLLSNICNNVYRLTPVINNEVINKNELTTTAINSCYKVLAAILRTEVEPNLGLTGTGQDVSIMRSTLMRTKILVADEDGWYFNRNTGDKCMNMVLETIYHFMEDSICDEKRRSFAELYQALMSPKGPFGLRRGVIPIYLAVALHGHKKNVLIYDQGDPVNITADVLQQINAQPERFFLEKIDWSSAKEGYIEELEHIFADFITKAESTADIFEHVARGMFKWYVSLPKYSRDMRCLPDGTKIASEMIAFRKVIKDEHNASELLFDKLPKIFDLEVENTPELCKAIGSSKDFYDQSIGNLEKSVGSEVRQVFQQNQPKRASLKSIMLDYCDNLPQAVFEEIFADGTGRFLEICRMDGTNDTLMLTNIVREATGLRLNDWSDATFDVFKAKIHEYKKTVEEYSETSKDDTASLDDDFDGYEFLFQNAQGKAAKKRFTKVECSPRAKLLRNSLLSNIEAMGQSITEQEKRQVLAELLQEYC
ncbi:MAG: restriction endonuclease subunit S [Selenomonadaceae bacterium]|nr:restriction endonuclease subunit S [Selenomonadaceae bacterium]